jgi:hypothetical protein
MKPLELVGLPGEVRYTVGADYGTVTLHDKYGTLQQIECALGPTSNETLSPDTKVLVASWDPNKKYLVNKIF